MPWTLNTSIDNAVGSPRFRTAQLPRATAEAEAQRRQRADQPQLAAVPTRRTFTVRYRYNDRDNQTPNFDATRIRALRRRARGDRGRPGYAPVRHDRADLRRQLHLTAGPAGAASASATATRRSSATAAASATSARTSSVAPTTPSRANTSRFAPASTRAAPRRGVHRDRHRLRGPGRRHAADGCATTTRPIATGRAGRCSFNGDAARHLRRVCPVRRRLGRVLGDESIPATARRAVRPAERRHRPAGTSASTSTRTTCSRRRQLRPRQVQRAAEVAQRQPAARSDLDRSEPQLDARQQRGGQHVQPVPRPAACRPQHDIRFGYELNDSNNALRARRAAHRPRWPRRTSSSRCPTSSTPGTGRRSTFSIPQQPRRHRRRLVLREARRRRLQHHRYRTVPAASPTPTGDPRIDWLGGLTTGDGNRPYTGNTFQARVIYKF